MRIETSSKIGFIFSPCPSPPICESFNKDDSRYGCSVRYLTGLICCMQCIMCCVSFVFSLFQGFTGGQLLKKKQEAEQSKSDVELVNIQRSYNLKGSVSLPHISDTKNIADSNTEIPAAK